MSRTKVILLFSAAAAVIAASVVLLIVLRPRPDDVTTDDIVDLTSTDLAGAQERLLHRWVKVKGVVLEKHAVTDFDGKTFTMIDFQNKKNLEIKASFDASDVPDLDAGVEAVIVGRCVLCQKGETRPFVVYFEECAVVSHSKPGK